MLLPAEQLLCKWTSDGRRGIHAFQLNSQLRTNWNPELLRHLADGRPPHRGIRTDRLASNERDVFVPQSLKMLKSQSRRAFVIQDNISHPFHWLVTRHRHRWQRELLLD